MAFLPNVVEKEVMTVDELVHSFILKLILVKVRILNVAVSVGIVSVEEVVSYPMF